MSHADDPRVLEAVPEATQLELLHAERFELLSVICEREPDPGEASVLEEYPIRKAVVLEDPAERAAALGALYASLSAPGAMAFCFDPHHVIRTTHEGHVLLAVICFECGQVQFYRDGEERGGAGIGDAGEAALNALLGQKATKPAGEVMGRSPQAWAERLRASLEAGKVDDRLLDVTDPFLFHADPTVRALGAECRRWRLAKSPSSTLDGLMRDLDNAHLDADPEHFTTAIELVAEFAKTPSKELSIRQSQIGLADALRSQLESDRSPEVHAAAAKALLAFRWVPASVLAQWRDESKQILDDELRARLLKAFEPLDQ